MSILPKKNDLGFYEIRLESIARDPKRPVTIGAHMDGADLMNIHYQ